MGAAGYRFEIADGLGRAIVADNFRALDFLNSPSEGLLLMRGYPTRKDISRTHTRPRADHAFHEGNAGHLQGEDKHTLLLVEGHILRDLEGACRLPNRWSCRQDNHISAAKAEHEQIIQGGDACANADAGFASNGGFDVLCSAIQSVGDGQLAPVIHLVVGPHNGGL